MMRYLIFLLWMTASVGGCRGEKKETAKDETSAVEIPADQGEMVPDNEGSVSKNAPDREPIRIGSMAVLGLALPQRMTPAKSAPNVYRFTGNYPSVHLVDYFREQLKRSKLTREGEDYLIRFGKVRRPVGRSTGEELLAIRVGKGMKGVIVDIWQEKDYKKSLPESYRRSAKRRVILRSRKTVRVDPGVAQVRNREKEETLRVMQKIAAGQKLDPKDYDSAFFD